MRTPVVKRLAKQTPLENRDAIIRAFLASGDREYEMTLFVGLLAARKGDYAATREYLKALVPEFDSWAHPDVIVPCLRWTDINSLFRDFDYLLGCEGQYEVRTYIIMLLTRALDAEHIDFALDALDRRVRYGMYYVDMAAAWCLAEALARQYDKTLEFIKGKTLPAFVYNKAIQKARESFRITDAQKSELFELRIKFPQ